MMIQTRILGNVNSATAKSWDRVSLDLDEMEIRYFLETSDGHTQLDLGDACIVIELSYDAFHEAYLQWRENTRLGIDR